MWRHKFALREVLWIYDMVRSNFNKSLKKKNERIFLRHERQEFSIRFATAFQEILIKKFLLLLNRKFVSLLQKNGFKAKKSLENRHQYKV